MELITRENFGRTLLPVHWYEAEEEDREISVVYEIYRNVTFLIRFNIQ